MKTVRITDATPNQLSYLVAVAEGHEIEESLWVTLTGPGAPMTSLRYSEDWELMGPILDRAYGVTVRTWSTAPKGVEVRLDTNDGGAVALGPTICIAAARAYVALRIGPQAFVPEELT